MFQQILILIYLLSHTGDGNFHVLIFFRPDHPEEVAEAKKLASDMALKAIALGGTCTGEHGIGVGKKEYLRAEMGENTINLMKAIKTTMDPKNIMNPGKMLDMNSPPKTAHTCCASSAAATTPPNH